MGRHSTAYLTRYIPGRSHRYLKTSQGALRRGYIRDSPCMSVGGGAGPGSGDLTRGLSPLPRRISTTKKSDAQRHGLMLENHVSSSMAMAVRENGCPRSAGREEGTWIEGARPAKRSIPIELRVPTSQDLSFDQTAHPIPVAEGRAPPSSSSRSRREDEVFLIVVWRRLCAD